MEPIALQPLVKVGTSLRSLQLVRSVSLEMELKALVTMSSQVHPRLGLSVESSTRSTELLFIEKVILGIIRVFPIGLSRTSFVPQLKVLISKQSLKALEGNSHAPLRV